MTPAAPADLLLRDAPVYRDGRWQGDCLAVRDGTIVAVGGRDDVAHLLGPGTEVESLAGHRLLPAFHDSHVHPVQGGIELDLCNLTDVSTIDGYLHRITTYASTHPDRRGSLDSRGCPRRSAPRGNTPRFRRA